MLYTNREISTVLHESGLLDVLSSDVLETVMYRYGDDTRHYHDFDHAVEVVSWVNRALEDIPLLDLDPYSSVELRLAALFHDVVYGIEGSPVNEQKSCEMFRKLVDGLISEASMARVCELIMFTANHGKLEAADVPLAGQLLLDADIASLGTPRWEIFVHNNENVVEELKAKYTDEQIAIGRKAFLGGLLNKRTIYLSDWFRLHLEDQARRNLTRVLAEVGEPPKEVKKRGQKK